MKRRIAAILAIAALAGPSYARTPDDLRDAAAQQEAIRKRTASLADQLDGLIADYVQSGLEKDPEVAVLKEARRALAGLSEEEMAAVVRSLQAGKGPEARAKQDEVIAKLKKVLADYQRRRDAQELARRAHELMLRQQAAMQGTINFAKTAGNKPWEAMDGRKRQAVQMLEAQQRAMNAEAAELTPVPPELAAQLKEQMEAAAAALQEGAVFKAAAHQRNARDLLRKIERAVSPERDRKRQLEDAAAELATEIATQQSILDQVRGTRDARRLPQHEQAEGELADAVDETRADLAELMPRAAADADQALKMIQLSRGKLQNRIPTAAADQQTAINFLKAAREKVLEELGKKPDLSPEDQQKLKAIEEAQKKLDKLIEQQAKASQKAADAAGAKSDGQRQEGARQAAEEQEKAQQQEKEQEQDLRKASPEAAKSAEKSEQPMQAADDTLRKGDPQGAQEQQAEAEQRLEEAQRQLAKDADKIRGKEGDEREAAKQAAKEAAEQAGEAQKKMGDPNSPSEAQAEGLAKQASDMARHAGRSGEKALDDAKEALREAAAAAKNGDREKAKEAIGKAQGALKKAGDSLDSPSPPESEGAMTADGKRSSRSQDSNSSDKGAAAAIALPPRDRAALEQAPPETFPPEYRAMIDQYLKSLTGSPGGK